MFIMKRKMILYFFFLVANSLLRTEIQQAFYKIYMRKYQKIKIK